MNKGSKDLVSARTYRRAFNFADCLAKWESGAFPSKAALARHYGVERPNVGYALRVARIERERGLNAEVLRHFASDSSPSEASK